MMTDEPMIFDVLEDATALSAARLGDMLGLSELVRNGANLSVEEREFIADFLIGKAKIDSKNARKSKTVEELASLGWWVLYVQAKKGGPLDAAYADMIAMTGISLRTLKSAVRACRTNPGATARMAYFQHLERRRVEGCKKL